jgi:nucleotide-binding universal stress UspA family protein
LRAFDPPGCPSRTTVDEARDLVALTPSEARSLHVARARPRITLALLVDRAAARRSGRRLAAGGTLETALLSGRVAHQITCYARDKRIGLIVLGTHGRTGVSHALLGCVAESVVRLAPCPVLTIPATAGEAGNVIAGGGTDTFSSMHRLRQSDRGSDLRDMPDAHSRRGARAETGRGTSCSPRRARMTGRRRRMSCTSMS